VVQEPCLYHLSQPVNLEQFVFHEEMVEVEFAPVHQRFRVVSLILEDLYIAAEDHSTNLHPARPEHSTGLPCEISLAPILLLNIVACQILVVKMLCLPESDLYMVYRVYVAPYFFVPLNLLHPS
jgi:hypothetical protein